MSLNGSPLGVCPNCGVTLSQAEKLIEYRREDGSVGVYADCSSCDDVVHPNDA